MMLDSYLPVGPPTINNYIFINIATLSVSLRSAGLMIRLVCADDQWDLA